MRKTLLFTLSAICLLCSCSKEYKYIEIVKEKDIIGSGYRTKKCDPIIIEAKNDTAAYLLAFKKFCISVKAHERTSNMLKGIEYTIPEEFILLNNEDIDITSVYFSTRDSEENKIVKQISKLGLKN